MWCLECRAVDGTLLNSAHQLTDANTRVILKAKENGIRFCLATGERRRHDDDSGGLMD